LLAVTAPAPIFDAVTAPLRSLGAVTAFFLSCFVPTLFLGRLVAAYAVPPSARKRATREMASDGVGLFG
jgi:hypothetical protein